jgi:3-carboxy-cis,cis-muconate cycloisomerase
MLDTLDSTNGLIVAEAVMMGIVQHKERQAAHYTVYATCKYWIESETHLLDVPVAGLSVTAYIDDKKLLSMCGSLQYTYVCAAVR